PAPLEEDDVQDEVRHDVQDDIREDLREEETMDVEERAVKENQVENDGLQAAGGRKKRRRKRKKKSNDSASANANPNVNTPGSEPPLKKPKLEDPVDAMKKHGHRNQGQKRQNRTKTILQRPDEQTSKSITNKHGKRVFPGSEPTNGKVPISTLRQGAASTGYIGNAQAPLPEVREWQLDELVSEHEGSWKFGLITAKDCTQYIPCPKTKNVYAVIDLGPRNDPTWHEDCDEATEYIRNKSNKCRFHEDDAQRRGRGFSSVSFGMSSGNATHDAKRPGSTAETSDGKVSTAPSIQEDSRFYVNDVLDLGALAFHVLCHPYK
ncbi:hypothetical protein V5O48_015396, partial [Marasmius crinis-equi]